MTHSFFLLTQSCPPYCAMHFDSPRMSVDKHENLATGEKSCCSGRESFTRHKLVRHAGLAIGGEFLQTEAEGTNVSWAAWRFEDSDLGLAFAQRAKGARHDHAGLGCPSLRPGAQVAVVHCWPTICDVLMMVYAHTAGLPRLRATMHTDWRHFGLPPQHAEAHLVMLAASLPRQQPPQMLYGDHTVPLARGVDAICAAVEHAGGIRRFAELHPHAAPVIALAVLEAATGQRWVSRSRHNVALATFAPLAAEVTRLVTANLRRHVDEASALQSMLASKLLEEVVFGPRDPALQPRHAVPPKPDVSLCRCCCCHSHADTQSWIHVFLLSCTSSVLHVLSSAHHTEHVEATPWEMDGVRHGAHPAVRQLDLRRSLPARLQCTKKSSAAGETISFTVMTRLAGRRRWRAWRCSC